MMSPHPSRRLQLVAVAPAEEPTQGSPPPVTLEAAFRQYSAYVARIGIRILGRDDEEIDDLVQDVFTHATAGLLRMTEPAEVRGWFATVTVRVAVRRLRARRLRRFFYPQEAAATPEPISPLASPEQRALVARVYQALDRLPARQRAAWVLRHVEGERLEEVAQHCRCSLATAKRLIARAEDWLERNMRDVAI